MLTYIFWHWPADPAGHEEGLVEFHQRLLVANVDGLQASAWETLMGAETKWSWCATRIHLMAKRRRKTLVTWRPCHENIHVGRSAAPVRR